MTVRTFAREPLVQFLGLGALILAVSALAGGPSPAAHRIVVSRAKLQQLRETWTGQWGEPPTEAQLRSLVDDFLREEVLYREAVASGMDREDTIIRRHLAQKVDFVAQGAASLVEPSEDDLQRYFQAHRQQYAVPAKVAFQHVYFSAARGVASASSRADSALRALATDRDGGVVPAIGDAFMLQSAFALQSREQVRDTFGAQFADRLFSLPLNQWSGPVPSTYGEHLVRVTQATPAAVPPLDEVRDQVRIDFSDWRAKAAADAYYAKVRARYQVAFEAPVEAVR